MALKYNNFTVPYAEDDRPSGWAGASQGLDALSSVLGQYAASRIDQQDALRLAMLKARAEKQAEFDMQQRQNEAVLNYAKQNPALFGMPSFTGSSTATQPSAESDSAPFMLLPDFRGGMKVTDNPQYKEQAAARKEQVKQETKLAGKRQQDLAGMQRVKANLDFMKEKAMSLPSGYGSLGVNFKNFMTRGESNPDLALYEKQLPAMSVSIYRDLTGDTRLSDSDAQGRAYPLFWNPGRGEGESIKIKSFDDLEKLYQARERLVSKGAYQPNPLDKEEMIIPFDSIMNEAGLGKGKVNNSQGSIPKYDPKTQKLQRNSKTGEYRVVSK